MDLTTAISAGSANPVFLFAMALLLGALHGLEPGHSKTMMAAYIIAIRGTVFQAVLLGLSAATSHVIIVWIVAILGLKYGNELIGEDFEPALVFASGGIIVGIGLWIFWQALREKGSSEHTHHHHHHHHHHQDADHHDDDLPSSQDTDHMDAHALSHAKDIEARLQSGRTTTWQTILFGLSGGLIPCPAAITVLLLCLQLKKMALGLTLVTAFSLGLAAMLVVVGISAALGLRFAAQRTPWLDTMLRKAPLVSAVLICTLGLFMMYAGINHTHS